MYIDGCDKKKATCAYETNLFLIGIPQHQEISFTALKTYQLRKQGQFNRCTTIKSFRNPIQRLRLINTQGIPTLHTTNKH
jgi:hypothetical protein